MVTVYWEEGVAREPRVEHARSTTVKLRLVFFNGRTAFSLKDLSGPPVCEDKVVRFRKADGDLCEVTYDDAAAAAKFGRELETAWGKYIQTELQKKRQAESSPPASPRKVTGSRSGRKDLDVATLGDVNCLRDADTLRYASTPDNPSKRSCIADSGTAGLLVTPEKVPRTIRGPQVRVARRPITIMTTLPSKPQSPQRSASYAGYRLPAHFGLENLGNTCYMNAVLQAISALREFVRDLTRMAKDAPPTEKSELLPCAVQVLQEMAETVSTGPVNPGKLREQVAKANPMFSGRLQQDAHEFFLEFLNQVHDALMEARTAWLASGTQEDVVLATQSHFDSEIQKVLHCTSCDQPREVVERFRDLSLDFPGEGVPVVEQMLRAYFEEELLEVKCEKCSACAATLQKQLARQPRVLVLHLKRFLPNFQQRRYEKRLDNVVIPDRLDLKKCLGDAETCSPHCQKEEGLAPASSPARLPARPLAAEAPSSPAAMMHRATGLSYRLRAVIAHEGSSPQSGHYICYSRGTDSAWRMTWRGVGADSCQTCEESEKPV